MKKILGIVGSPRRNGNTHIAVNRIIDAAKERGAIGETIFLSDLIIRECDGCHACWKTGLCAKKDNMNAIFQKIIEADILIFGTPVYWYGPTALMKAFIDRMVYFNCPENRIKIKGKKAVVVIPYEEENPETVRPVVEFFEKSLSYLELNIIKVLTAPGLSERGEIKDNPEYMDQAAKIGESLV